MMRNLCEVRKMGEEKRVEWTQGKVLQEKSKKRDLSLVVSSD